VRRGIQDQNKVNALSGDAMPCDDVALPDVCLALTTLATTRARLPITAKLAALVIGDLAEEEARKEASTAHRASAPAIGPSTGGLLRLPNSSGTVQPTAQPVSLLEAGKLVDGDRMDAAGSAFKRGVPGLEQAT